MLLNAIVYQAAVNLISLFAVNNCIVSSTIWTCILSGEVVVKHGGTRGALVSIGIVIVNLTPVIVHIATSLAVAFPELSLQFSDDTINPFKWNGGWLGQFLRIKGEAGLRPRLIYHCVLVALSLGTVLVLVKHSFFHSILFPHLFRLLSLHLFFVVLSAPLNCF